MENIPNFDSNFWQLDELKGSCDDSICEVIHRKHHLKKNFTMTYILHSNNLVLKFCHGYLKFGRKIT